MKKIYIVLLTFSLIIIFKNSLVAQGCSDAGFCTINGLKPSTIDSINKTNQIKLGLFFGNADNGVNVWGNYIEYNKQINRKWALDCRINSLGQSKGNISTFGISDILLTTNYSLNKNYKLILGTKIPLNTSNKSTNEGVLPMDFQSSLGTFDIIVGASFSYKNVQIMAAFQQPLTQNNNSFIASNFLNNKDINTFLSTNNFKRSGDVLFRFAYPFSLAKKIKLTPSILQIYHLTNDKFNEPSEEIKNSKGVTLNANAFVDFELTKNSQIQFTIASPLIVRKIRPDGLTRSLLLNFEYRFQF